MRKVFFILCFLLFGITILSIYLFNTGYGLLILLTVLLAVGIYDVTQKTHAILRNFPLIGHFRYILESISPEIQQYFIETSTDGVPFNRNLRSLAYRRAKGVNDTVPFGTQKDLTGEDYMALRHSIYAKHLDPEIDLRVEIGGTKCTKKYSASILNISAMSFGSLSANAVRALNNGAKQGNFYHNTGEGAISRYHREGGGDLVWQIGTGYFGCRDKEGNFDEKSFQEKAVDPQVKMIEIKLSQGAKPGHGGVLPGIKNTKEIAEIRGVEPGTTVLSPPSHKAFTDPESLVKFIARLRVLSDGKPIGFKLCVGRTEEFVNICKEMVAQQCMPDFITVDGAEGGTGAAPLEFSDSVGLPLEPALIFVNGTLEKFNLRDQIKVIASGKALSAFSIIKNIALGADLCNSARGFMFSLGCIQALRCNSNDCPTGVATQDKHLEKGLVVTDKSQRVYCFHRNTVEAVRELLGAAGLSNTSEISIHDLVKGDEMVKLANRYFPDSVNTQI